MFYYKMSTKSAGYIDIYYSSDSPISRSHVLTVINSSSISTSSTHHQPCDSSNQPIDHQSSSIMSSEPSPLPFYAEGILAYVQRRNRQSSSSSAATYYKSPAPPRPHYMLHIHGMPHLLRCNSNQCPHMRIIIVSPIISHIINSSTINVTNISLQTIVRPSPGSVFPYPQGRLSLSSDNY